MNGITNIEYDLLGNPRKITFSNNRSIEYIYSADGRRLRTVHSKPKEAGIFDRPIRAKLRPGGIETMAMDKDSTDYIGNLILKDGHPSQYLFAGGYASFDAKADTLNGMHYYISDYLGNNRMVVNQDGTIEQVTHYYPYGGVIGDISHTNDDVTNDYKFENKELDRTFGLEWYDIQARQYDAIGVPGWNAIDPLSEKYYSISPYAYCGGNPVNFGDYDGMDWYKNDSTGNYTWFNDEGVDNPQHEGFTYVGPKGSVCGELEGKIDERIKKWQEGHKLAIIGLYHNGLSMSVYPGYQMCTVWDDFRNGTGADVSVFGPESQVTKEVIADYWYMNRTSLEYGNDIKSDPIFNTITAPRLVGWEWYYAIWYHLVRGGIALSTPSKPYFNNLNYIGSYWYSAFQIKNGLVHMVDNMMGNYSLQAHAAADYSRDQKRQYGATFQFCIW